MLRSLVCRLAVPLIVFGLLMVVYHLFLRQFFPVSLGQLGHDYSLGIPALVDGFLWFSRNGLFSTPWFSPSFCGGQAFFADPQSAYFSIPQFLTFVMEPVKAVYWSHLLMAGVGFAGMFLFSYVCLGATRWAALAAATVFMFNGFYSHRMIVGHLGYQPFMLTPLVAYFLAAPARERTAMWWSYVGLAGLGIAYWLQAGLTTLMVPSALAVVGLVLTLEILKGGFLCSAIGRGVLGATLALLICASKLVASLHLVMRFPRTEYPMPGFDSFWDVIQVVFSGLFYSSQRTYEVALPLWRNMQWAALPHELAFGVTIVPFCLFVAAFGAWGLRVARSKWEGRIDKGKAGACVGLIAILIFPLLLLYYSPGWNAVLKSIPIVGSTTSPMRWIIIYIPLMALWLAVSIDSIESRRIAAVACIVGVPLLNWFEERSFYFDQATYDPSSVEIYYRDVARGSVLPRIEAIRAASSEEKFGSRDMNALAHGYSPLYCYNPLYGYRLEKFRPEPLRDGGVLESSLPGYLNIRNPACLLYPQENGCRLWDPFRNNMRDAAASFADYRGFAFNVPRIQSIANGLTWFGSILGVVFIFSGISVGLRRIILRHDFCWRPRFFSTWFK